jgi:hypothetical protein
MSITIIGWNNVIDIDHTLRQYESNKLRKNTGESFRHWKAHKPDIGIPQE